VNEGTLGGVDMTETPAGNGGHPQKYRQGDDPKLPWIDDGADGSAWVPGARRT